MRRWSRSILRLMFLTAVASTKPVHRQAPQTSDRKQAFEVATIRRNTSLDGNGVMRNEPGGRFQVVNAPVFWLLAAAYSESIDALRRSQIIGAPSWLESENYDIAAKAATPDDMSTFNKRRLLLRSCA